MVKEKRCETVFGFQEGECQKALKVTNQKKKEKIIGKTRREKGVVLPLQKNR